MTSIAAFALHSATVAAACAVFSNCFTESLKAMIETDCEPANIWPRTDMQKQTGNLNREHRRLVRSARRARDLTDHCALLRVLGVACGFGLGAPIPTARRPLLRAAQSCPYSRRLDRHD